MNATIQANGLSKDFGQFKAVVGVDFDVQPGELFGFLGPNGAGKTTTVRMLTGVLNPTRGTASIQGYDILKHGLESRAQMAVVPEDANVYSDLTVQQNMRLMAALYRVPKAQCDERGNELLSVLGLDKRKQAKAGSLSKGMRQRLMLCCALVTQPKVLFLDEPTSGLDVQSTHLIQELVGTLNHEGLTVFLTTHNMLEAEAMCTRVAIINSGRIVAIDTPERIRSAIDFGHYLQVRFSKPVAHLTQLEKLPEVSGVRRENGSIRLYGSDLGALAVEVVRFADRNDLGVEHLQTCTPSLEDAFLYFTGSP